MNCALEFDRLIGIATNPKATKRKKRAALHELDKHFPIDEDYIFQIVEDVLEAHGALQTRPNPWHHSQRDGARRRLVRKIRRVIGRAEGAEPKTVAEVVKDMMRRRSPQTRTAHVFKELARIRIGSWREMVEQRVLHAHIFNPDLLEDDDLSDFEEVPAASESAPAPMPAAFYGQRVTALASAGTGLRRNM